MHVPHARSLCALPCGGGGDTTAGSSRSPTYPPACLCGCVTDDGCMHGRVRLRLRLRLRIWPPSSNTQCSLSVSVGDMTRGHASPRPPAAHAGPPPGILSLPPCQCTCSLAVQCGLCIHAFTARSLVPLSGLARPCRVHKHGRGPYGARSWVLGAPGHLC